MSSFDRDAAVKIIEGLYLENLNRIGEPEGVAFYLDQMAQGKTAEDIDRMMEASPEFAAIGGGGIVSRLMPYLPWVGIGLVAFMLLRKRK